jgi:hypothetical protein
VWEESKIFSGGGIDWRQVCSREEGAECGIHVIGVEIAIEVGTDDEVMLSDWE